MIDALKVHDLLFISSYGVFQRLRDSVLGNGCLSRAAAGGSARAVLKGSKNTTLAHTKGESILSKLMSWYLLILFISSFKKNLCIFNFICLHVCVLYHVCLVLTETRRGCWMPWIWRDCPVAKSCFRGLRLGRGLALLLTAL